MASSSLPEAGAKLTLDLTQWESNWSSVMDDASTLTSALDDLSGTVDIDFNIDDAALPFDDIPESTETAVETTQTEDSKKVVEGITFLATMKKIETVINIIGNAWEFAEKIGSFTVAPFLDIEDAVAKINAQTGGTGIADLGQLIRDIQFADLGDSVDQISDVMIKAQQLGLPIEEAARAALTFTHTWQDEDPSTVIGTLGTLVQTGLVDNLQEAADLMTVFFQQGGNVGGDALSVVEANAQAWADMGLTAGEALSTVESLQQGTGASATDAAKMIQTFDDALTAAAADPSSAQANTLKLMGIDNPKDQGLAIGAETINGFAEAFANMPSDQQDLISGLFFGKGGKKFTGAIEGMTTEGGMFADVVGAAEEAAAAADDSLRGIIDDFVLAVNESISNLLSSDAIDLPGKIENIKKGLQEALAVLQEGGTLGEAFEVGLKIEGVDEFITNFQRIIGNLEIVFLQLVASIQSITGHGAEAETTNKEIARLAGGQLSFDLKIANPDEVEGIVAQAVGRGVDPTKIGELAGDAVSELVGSGEFQRAQALVEALGLVSDTPVDADMGAMMQGNKAVPVTIDIPGLQAEIDKAVEESKPKPTGADWWNNLKPPDNFLEDALNTKMGAGGVSRTSNWWDQFTPTSESATLATDTKTALMEAATGVSDSMTTMKDEVGTSLAGTQTSFADTTLAAQQMDVDIAAAMMGNTVTASFDAVAMKAAETFPNVMAWFQKTSAAAAVFDATVSVHLRSIIKQLNDINFLAMVTIGNITQAQGLGGGAGGTTNNTTNNVVVNNTVNNDAQATDTGWAIGRALRG